MSEIMKSTFFMRKGKSVPASEILAKKVAVEAEKVEDITVEIVEQPVEAEKVEEKKSKKNK